MESPGNPRRHWPVAMTASVLLHGAALLGFSLLSGGQAGDVRKADTSPCLSFYVLDEQDAGEIHFEEPRRSANVASLNYLEKKTISAVDGAEPVAAVLRDPWASVAAEESDKGLTGPTPTGPGHAEIGAGTSFFQVAARGQAIVFVVDGSASMGKNGALKAACRELYQCLSKLPGTARFQVIIYNDAAHYLLPRSFQKWLEPTPAVLNEVGAALALAGKAPEGATDHEPALREALGLRPDVVFFLTDADDLKPTHLQLVTSLNRGRAIINTIELNTRNRGRTEMPLQIMARENGGCYQAVDLR
jgi:hypothetical protein